MMSVKPNIVIIMADQLRADLRASCGYPIDTMPFLDEWSQGGVDFCRAYTANPSCMPARVSMFTGRYCQSHMVRTNHNVNDVRYTRDLLDVLKAQGYATALCGKNHSHRRPEDFDFANCCMHGGYPRNANRTPEEQAVADFLTGLKSKAADVPAPGTVKEQCPYRIVDDTLRFVDELPPEQPFFVWASFPEPHPPYQVPAEYFNLFPPRCLPPHSGPEHIPAKGLRYQWAYDIWGRVMGDEMEQRVLRARSNYLGMMRLIDDQLKRLIEGFEARGLTENTVFLFLADHGDFAGEYGLTRKGPDLSEALTRIPMIWRGPGIRALGQEVSSCVNIVDILPTLCHLLGVDTPFGCQGKSILPLLTGGAYPAGEYDVAYAESGYGGQYWTADDDLDPITEGATKDYTTFDTLNSWTQSGQVRMVRKGDFKLQLDMMGEGYLYNLREDPHELRNRWGDPACAAQQADMLCTLSVAMMRAADPLPPPRARYRVKTHPHGWWEEPFFCEDPGVTRL